MKSILSILVTVAAVISVQFSAHAQLSANFNRELMAILNAEGQALKGKVVEKQQNATIYASRLSLSGFEPSYAETPFGTDFHAKYASLGSPEIMDAIAEKFLELPFVAMDSKKDKKVLGSSLLSSNVKRRVKLVNVDGKTQVNVELDDKGNIIIYFPNK